MFRLVTSLCLLITALKAKAAQPVEGITFFNEPGVIYLPVDEAARALRWEVRRNTAGQCTQLEDLNVQPASLRCLNDGTELVFMSQLQEAGASVSGMGQEVVEVRLRWSTLRFSVITSPKRAEVNLTTQELTCWQGEREVMRTHISSGKNGSTPTGAFTAGPFRAEMHYSSRYENAPMPWSVQINGHVFIHGFESVPNYPASLGCIRVPLTGRNPARFFYEWIDNGSPVVVTSGAREDGLSMAQR